MSMFSFPDAMTPDAMMKSMPDMTEWTNGLPVVSPLMTHPVAACVAATALGFGIASHMSGLFWGSIEATMAAPLRFAAVPGGLEPDVVATAKTEPRAPVVVRTARAVEGVAELKTAAKTAAEAVVENAAKVTAEPAVAAEALDGEDMRRPSEREKPERPDDLKRISGIGPKLEQVLNGLGLWTFEQIAVLTAAETAWLDDYLQFRGRIERDAWQKQALELMDAAG